MVQSSLGGIVGRNLYKIIEASASIGRQSTDTCFVLSNLEDTICLGKALVREIPNLKVLLLEGSLGVGKTSLVKGIAASLGITEPITSPTFALAQHYTTGKIPLIHLDLYRLEAFTDADEIFLQEEEAAHSLDALIVVEWPERMRLALPEAWKVQLRHRLEGGRLAQLIPPISPSKKASTSA